MRRVVAAACAAWTLLSIAAIGRASAQTDNYPSRPIKLVLPQPPGGAVDLISRTIADRLSEQMKQPVIVENMPGANGGLAAGHVARSAADGYTLMMAVDGNLVINPSLYQNLTYDTFRDFAPISVVAKLNMVLVANPKVAANNVGELIAFARANPNKLNYAGIGYGNAVHMGMELLKFQTKTDINHVPYRGTAAAMTDVVAGVVEVMLIGPQAAKSMSEGGRLKVLGVASLQRMPALPDVPTIDESGVPGFEMGSWFGMVAPAKTPKAVVDRIALEVGRAAKDPRFTGAMASQGLQVVGSTPGQMAQIMRDDTRKWSDLIVATGIKIPQ